MKPLAKPAAAAAIFFCAAAASLTANAAPNFYYTLTDLGNFQVADVNNKRQVIGNEGSSAVLWENGVKTVLGEFTAQAINNKGDIVGFQGSNAVFYSKGTLHNLGDGRDLFGNSGDQFAVAHGLNDKGTVIGEAGSPPGSGVPWVHDGSGPMKTVDRPAVEAEYTRAVSINDAGQIAGYSCGYTCFSWISHNGNTTVFDVQENPIIAADINNHGHVTGSGYYNTDNAYIYENGQVHWLPRLDGEQWYGISINDRGDVAGQTGTPVAGYSTGRAVIYHEGATYDIASLLAPGSGEGWALNSVSSMNAKGDIVGYGTFNGERRAVLLIDPPIVGTSPVPEPETYALFAAGLAMLGVAVRRRRSS